MSSISFTIPWVCRAKQGDRARAIKTGDGRTFVKHYPAEKTRENAKTLASLIVPHRPDKPMRGPLRLDLTFRYAWRKGDSQKRRALGRWWKDTHPDYDNLCKQISDVLEASGFMGNDGQIAVAHVEKILTDSPGVDVTLRELEEAL